MRQEILAHQEVTYPIPTWICSPCDENAEKANNSKLPSPILLTLTTPSEKQRLNDREIVVQPGRAAEMVNMIQQFIDDTFAAFSQGRQIGDAIIQIPGGPFLAEDFKDAVAKNQQARTERHGTGPGREIDFGEHAHNRASGRQKERSRLATNQKNGWGVTTAAPSQRPVRPIVNAIPDRKEPIAVAFALEGVIESGQHLIGLPHIGCCKRTRADHVCHGDRNQRGIQPVARDVNQVKREVIVINPMITDGVAAES